MTKAPQFILALTLLATLTCCKPRDNSNYDFKMIQQIDTALPKSIDAGEPTGTSPAIYPFVGEWVYNNAIFYTSELTLRVDGTFKYHNQGCTEQTFTEGRWAKNDGGIVLSSFEAYRRPEEVWQPNKTTIAGSRVKRKGIHNPPYALIELPRPTVIHIPGPNDTTNIYFDKIKLQWGFGCLFCFDRSSPLGYGKFTRAIITPTVELSH